MNVQQAAWQHKNADIDDSDAYPFAHIMESADRELVNLNRWSTAAIAIALIGLALVLL